MEDLESKYIKYSEMTNSRLERCNIHNYDIRVNSHFGYEINLQEILNDYYSKINCLTSEINNLESIVMNLSIQNKFLLKLLASKDILIDENEVNDLIESDKVAKKLSEG